ncbi:MAG: hypothetical protein L7F78_02445 [Syntrophales bacterium LBB04]|jgi:hypothetical protein|nr:hypothetical protein [Syntrophales bacterium LBB04]
MNNRIYRHILLPAVAPLLFLVVATTPVDVLGCRNRGLLAVAIALLSVLAGLGAAIVGARGRMKGKPDANWWATTALILAIPAVLLIVFA